jgi:hypothetical protein
MLVQLHQGLIRSISDPISGLRAIKGNYPELESIRFDCQFLELVIEKILSPEARIQDLIFSAANPEMVALIDELINMHNNTLMKFEERLTAHGFSPNILLPLEEIRESQIIYFEKDMSCLLSGQAYCSTEFNNEDEFTIDAKFVGKQVVEKILAKCVLIKSVSSSINNQGFKVELVLENTELRDTVLEDYFRNIGFSEEN